MRHGGNADVVRQELASECGIAVSLRTVERACVSFRQRLAATARATIRFETPPGRQLQIDFGERRVVIGGVPARFSCSWRPWVSRGVCTFGRSAARHKRTGSPA